MYNFTYHRASGLKQAQNLLGQVDDAKLIAGGQSLLPMMKLRLAAPANLIDIGQVEGLTGIELNTRSLTVGAMTTHHAVNTSPVVDEAMPALSELAGMIGDPAVRYRGTLGGSLAHNDPTADYPAACLALDATIITTKRRIAAADFFTGLFETALEPEEIITKVSFPLAKKAAYQKFRNPASRYAIVGVFVAKRPSDVGVAVTGAGTSGAFRLPEFEEALKKRFSPKSLEGLTVPTDDLTSDLHASAAYRAHLIGVLARRAVAAALERGD
jgi:carbon-monoxide dehydrogenase medium subunit